MHSISAVRFSDCEPGACPSAVWDWCLRGWSLHHLPSARVPSLRGWIFRTPRVLPCSSLSCSPYGLGVYLYMPYVNAAQSSPTIGIRTCRHGYVSNGVRSASPLASSQTHHLLEYALLPLGSLLEPNSPYHVYAIPLPNTAFDFVMPRLPHRRRI